MIGDVLLEADLGDGVRRRRWLREPRRPDAARPGATPLGRVVARLRERRRLGLRGLSRRRGDRDLPPRPASAAEPRLADWLLARALEHAGGRRAGAARRRARAARACRGGRPRTPRGGVERCSSVAVVRAQRARLALPSPPAERDTTRPSRGLVEPASTSSIVAARMQSRSSQGDSWSRRAPSRTMAAKVPRHRGRSPRSRRLRARRHTDE